MYKNIKFKLAIICSFIFVYIFFQNSLYALTQQEVGEAIATFALNFQKAPDGGQTWTYDYNAKNRSEAYHGRKHSDGTYHADCVGWVSMCLHQSIGLDAANVASGACGFVTPTRYKTITYAGRANGSVIEKVKGKLMPGDILANSHHVMVYVGNIDGEDRIVHSVGSPLNYDTFKKYKTFNSTGGSDIDGTYTQAWRITEEYAAKLTPADLKTTWNGSGGDYSWGNSASFAGSVNLEDYEGYSDYEIKEEDTKKNYRIVNINDKLPMYKHILLTEKYNFNNIQWDRYGHSSDGGSSPTKEDLTLGLMYPSDDNDTKLGKFVSLVQPYLQTWYIPLGMYSGILSSSSGMPLSGSIYSGDAVYSGANNREIVWNFLISKGLSEVSAAAIMGNIACEAGINFNPKAIEKGNNNAGFGLCQWSYGRRDAIVKFARKQGREPDDITLQLDFLWLEMSGEDKSVACQFLGSSSFEKFKSFNDIDSATNYFCDKFERPNAKYAHKDRRRKNAKDFYNQYQGTFSGGGSSGTYTSSGGTGSFTTYDLTDAELTKIANLCQQEQGTAQGAAAEASLMANRFELYGKKYGTGKSGLLNYVRNSKWFAHAGKYMDNGPNSGKLKDDIKAAVKSVLVDGKRTLPVYVDEHDCISDLTTVTTNGSAIDKNNRDKYVKNKTIIKNRYGAKYTFYCFPTKTSDPFGYTSEKNRTKYGDFCYDFASGDALGSLTEIEIPKAAKNINFPYSLIRNGYHEIIVNRYDMQRYNLNTKYREYIEHKKKSTATLTKTTVIIIDAADGLQRQIRNDKVITNCKPDTKVSDTPKNTRKNSSGAIDPMLEDFVSSATSITNKYFLHRAFTFDMIYTNEFDYKKYSDEDANARRNADSESIVNRAPYKETFDEENRFTKADIEGKDINEIVAATGAKYTVTRNDRHVEVVEGTTQTKITTVQVFNIEGKEFIEHDGEEIYISRTWADELSQSGSQTKQVDYDEMVAFNENKDSKGNRSTVKKADFEKSPASEWKKYKQMSKEGNLNLIDIMNSNPKLISTYLNETSKQSEYMGYTKHDDLLVSYSQLKNLIKKTENENGLVPYAYFISLGFNMGFSNYQGMDELLVTNNFGWPVDLEGNAGAKQINCIYPYTPAYGESHGAIDIAPGKGNNTIIAAKDGVVKQILIDNGKKEGYGNAVVIQHENGFYTRYAHLSTVYSDIVVGTEVKKGDALGIMGTTGNSTGVHLHFEILEGGTALSNRVDPLEYYITEPEYGSINPNKITGLPSGYKFKSEKVSFPDMLAQAEKMTKEDRWTYNQSGDRGVCKTLDQLYNKKNMDCSAFVSSLYNIFLKVDPGSYSGEIIDTANKPGSGFVAKKINGDWSQVQPGDILWREGHVGLYMGDKRQIDAGGPTGVREPNESNVAQGRYTHFIRYVGK